jgi:FkbM family methyltransferase
MFKKKWKQMERSLIYKRGKLCLKRIFGKELRIKTDIEIHTVELEGWFLHPDILNRQSIVYSFGVGRDIKFDKLLIDRFNVELHAFDPTPSTVEWIDKIINVPSNFIFHPWAVGANDNILKLYPRIKKGGQKSEVMYTIIEEKDSVKDVVHVPSFSIKTILDKLEHAHIDLLKMDIEGAEYDVLMNMLNSNITPVQLLVEFHHRFSGIGIQKTAECISRLRDAGYRIFAVSATGRELSFIHPVGRA